MNLNVRGRALLIEWLASDPARSQSSLARKLRVRQSAVSLWIRGNSRPEPHLREALALITGIPAVAWESDQERAFIEEIRAEIDSPSDPSTPTPPPPPPASKRRRSVSRRTTPPPARTTPRAASKAA